MNSKIKALLYSSNIWYLGEGMFGPLLAVFTQRVGGNILDITWAWSIYLVVTGLVTIAIGRWIATTRNTEQVMLFGYILNTIFTFGYLLVQSPLMLFIIQAGLGVASACATPTWNALYSRNEDKDIDVLEWGLADGEANIIVGIAIVTGGFIISYTSFNTLFIIMGCIQIVSTGYLVKYYFRSGNKHRKSPAQGRTFS